MFGPFATASRYITIHQVSLLSHTATVARRLRIDVHNDDDDNNDDNAWQNGPKNADEQSVLAAYV